MGSFPVEFPTTTADGFESFRLLHYLAFIKGADYSHCIGVIGKI